MPLDPRAQRFLAMLGAGGPRPIPAGIGEQRQAFRTLMASAGTSIAPVPTENVQVSGAVGDLPARVYRPASSLVPMPALVFFHGGGFVAGDLDTHEAICTTLARAAGVIVISVGYRLAPEHPFPAAVEDSWAAAEAVWGRAAALGADPERLAVGGDSVGANLAASTCQSLVRSGHRVRAQLLICPVLDGHREGASHELFREGYFLDAATLTRELAAYAGPHGLDLADPRVSPSRTLDLAGLPPTIIETAEYDMVRDDGAAYATRLAEAGVKVEYTCHPGMIHLFYGFGRVIPYGQEALQAMGRRLAETLA